MAVVVVVVVGVVRTVVVAGVVVGTLPLALVSQAGSTLAHRDSPH